MKILLICIWQKIFNLRPKNNINFASNLCFCKTKGPYDASIQHQYICASFPKPRKRNTTLNYDIAQPNLEKKQIQCQGPSDLASFHSHFVAVALLSKEPPYEVPPDQKTSTLLLCASFFSGPCLPCWVRVETAGRALL